MRCILLLDLTEEELLALAECEDPCEVIEVEGVIWTTEGDCEAKGTLLVWRVRDEFEDEWDVMGCGLGRGVRKARRIKK